MSVGDERANTCRLGSSLSMAPAKRMGRICEENTYLGPTRRGAQTRALERDAFVGGSVDSALLSDFLCGGQVIACDHANGDACVLARLHCFRNSSAERVEDTNYRDTSHRLFGRVIEERGPIERLGKLARSHTKHAEAASGQLIDLVIKMVEALLI